MNKFTTFDGLKLAFSDEGQGLPILCLAGLTRNSSDFDYVVPHLKGHRIIRLDYRGRGQSEWAADFNTYSIPIEAQDVLGLLDHLGLPKVAVIGTSRGGLIGMTLAAVAKNRLIGLCLNDIGPEIAPAGMTNIKGHLGQNPRFATQAEMADAMPSLYASFANVSASRWLSDVQHRTIETAAGLTNRYDPKLRDALVALSELPMPDLWPLFDALDTLPTALIRGANSDLLSMETATEMRRRRPDLSFTNVPDRGHVPFLDEPQSIEVILKWLKECA